MNFKIILILISVANLHSSENIWFFKSINKNMTNTMQADSLVLKATGDNIDSLNIAFEIWSGKNRVYNETWKSIYYFEYDRSNKELTQKYKEGIIKEKLNAFFNDDAFVLFEHDSLKQWPEQSSEIYENIETINWYNNYFYAYDSLKSSGIDSVKLESMAARYAFDSDEKRPETLRLWNSLSKNKPLTFIFFSGGEYTRIIAWDKLKKKFFIIWSCC